MISAADLIHQVLGAGADVERELTGGGMARVLVVRDNALGRRVVLKVLAPGTIAPHAAERFRREIQLALELQHPHIVPILAAGLTGDQPYLVMPFVEGGSLRDRLAQGPLGVVETVRVLRGVALALAYAHARGVVHRDIKPDNVLLASGTAVVTDFGIAKAIARARELTPGGSHTLTQAGTTLGTPTYMAPEQIVADPNVDHRADIYAFGVMAYELLAGKPPYTGATLQQLYTEHLASLPVPLSERRGDVPMLLAQLLMRCLAKNPEERPGTADELVAALDHPDVISGAYASMYTPATAPARAIAPAARRRALLWAAVFVVPLAVGAAVILPRFTAPAPAAAVPAGPPIVAVLPLAFIGSDSGDAYLADGVADAITSTLAQTPGVQAVSRTRATALQSQLAHGQPADSEIRSYLEGAVQEDEGTVRVALRLVRARDGVMLWGGLVSGSPDSLQSLYAAASAASAEAVRTRLK